MISFFFVHMCAFFSSTSSCCMHLLRVFCLCCFVLVLCIFLLFFFHSVDRVLGTIFGIFFPYFLVCLGVRLPFVSSSVILTTRNHFRNSILFSFLFHFFGFVKGIRKNLILNWFTHKHVAVYLFGLLIHFISIRSCKSKEKCNEKKKIHAINKRSSEKKFDFFHLCKIKEPTVEDVAFLHMKTKERISLLRVSCDVIKKKQKNVFLIPRPQERNPYTS